MTDTDDIGIQQTKAFIEAMASSFDNASPLIRLYCEAGKRFDTADLQPFVRMLTKAAIHAVGDVGNQDNWQLRMEVVEYLLVDLVKDQLTERFLDLDAVEEED